MLQARPGSKDADTRIGVDLSGSAKYTYRTR